MLKKTFIISLLITLLFFFPIKVRSVNVAPLFNVDVDPINAGSVADYHIHGSYSEYNKINVLKLYFREDTKFNFFGAPPGSIIVNGLKAIGGQFRMIEQDRSVEMTIYLSQYINSGDEIDILIKKEAGLVNPITPATCYKIRVVLVNYAGAEVGSILSNSYRITTSAVQGLSVSVDPNVKGIKARYTVSFATGARGELKTSSGGILIRFPEGTLIPFSLNKSNILINGASISAIYRDNENPYTLRIFAPFDIPARYFVTIVFNSELGISNPLRPGVFTIGVSTTSEPDWVESQPYEIFEPEVQDLEVLLNPDSIAVPCDLLVRFKTSQVGYLSSSSEIFIEFPADFDLSSVNLYENIMVNGEFATATREGNRIDIASPSNISFSSPVEVKISSSANIKNPLKAGEYMVNVWTYADSSKKTYTVNIKESFINILNFEALYTGLTSINEFKVKFVTGPVYTLVKNTDVIIMKFDDGFVFPENIQQGLVKVNENISSTVARDGNALYFTVPVDIPPSGMIEIFIPQEFGIKNPTNIGEYGVKVSTSKEPKEIESNRIKITPLPVVEYTVNPSAPDGLNGFYRTNPEITLSTSNGEKVFYKIDEGEFTEAKQAFKVPEGLHNIFAYAVDAGGNKGDVFKRDFKIDTTPPEVKIDNLNSNPVFKGSPGKLTGIISEPCTLKINEAILELNKDNLSFSVELNVYEGMPISIYVRDLAGNAKTMPPLSAHIDSTPPVITFLNMPLNLQSTGGNSSTIETIESSYAIELKLDEKGKVFINNSEVYSNGNIFTYNASLSNGENLFIVKAIDSAGNEATHTLVINKVNEKKIILQIGVTTAVLGGNTIELDAAPFIEKNYTLVPLRFISEAFGATVQWNEALKVINIIYQGKSIMIQVGSTVAIVEGSTAKLDVAPKIVNGRTFVPIRFISETFGAEVLWDGTTKTITIKIML